MPETIDPTVQKALDTYSKEDLSHYTVPLNEATAEGKQLQIASGEDRGKLIASGLNPERIDTFPKRVTALTIAAAAYQAGPLVLTP